MKYLIFDISTTAQPGIEDSQYLSWANKKGNMTPEEAYSKAGMHPEYGMVCGLSSFWVECDGKGYDINEAFTGTALNMEEEEALLLDFSKLLHGDVVLCGHNVKDFGIPFLAKRFLAHGIVIPDCIVDAICEESYIDTMRELACGGQSVMSLRATAWMMGIDDPRANIAVPRFYQLCQEGRIGEVKELTRQNAEVAARVFGNCVLGNLIEIN